MAERTESSEAGAGPESGLFEGLLVMLSGAALEALGERGGPEAGDPRVDLKLARQMIDLLDVLQVKTRGNLNPGEAALLEQLLFDLRMRFLNKAGSS